ncbi:MAG: hypothetical protein OEW67_07550 [Cyclobacteriaceae bacterium]|nr:hypothetical protein [Cyclobacteriaceae bacterium]
MDWVIDDAIYNSESTPEHLDGIKKNIYFIEDDIIVFNEILDPTSFTYDLQFGNLRKLTQHLDKYYLIINVADAKRPNAENRAKIKSEFKKISHKVQHVCVVTGENFWTNTLANFILRGTGYKSFITCKEFDKAKKIIDEIRILN